MSTSTIKLYKLKNPWYGKNFIIEDLAAYLADSSHLLASATTITNFQYQRLEKEMKIKINAIQVDGQPTSGNYNYCSITVNAYESYNGYFFVKNKKQIAESTIELTLEMDILNTFKNRTYSNITSGMQGYSISDRSHFTRMHKDRFTIQKNLSRVSVDKKTEYSNEFNSLISNSISSPISPAIYFIINPKQLLYAFTKVYTTPAPPTNANLLIQTGTLTHFYYEEVKGNGTVTAFEEMIDWIYFKDRKVIVGSGDRYGGTYSTTATFTPEDFIPSEANNYKRIVFSFSGGNVDFYYNNGSWQSLGNVNNPAITNFTFTFEEVKRTLHTGYLFRKVDNISENINPILFKRSADEILYEEDGENSWYLIYTNNDTVASGSDTAAKYINPVNLLITADSEINQDANMINYNISYYPSEVPQYANKPEYLVINKTDLMTGGSITIGGTTYTASDFEIIVIKKTNNSDNTFSKIWVLNQTITDMARWLAGTAPDYTNVSYVDFYKISSMKLYTSVWVVSWKYEETITFNYTNSGTFKAWKDIDLTEQKYIKAINIPYAPVSGLVNYTNADTTGFSKGLSDLLQLLDLQGTSFDRIISFNSHFLEDDMIISYDPNLVFYHQPISANPLYKYCESKLKNSEFFARKFVYDTYTFTFDYSFSGDYITELYDDYLISGFYVRYVVSKNMLSRFMFEFPQFELYKDSKMIDYPKSLIVDRNNEKALYNNAYVNYIKNGGYYYESNKNQRNNTINGMTTALSIVGSIASFAGGAASSNPMLIAAGVGLATSGISSIARTINTAQEADKALAFRMNQLANQATGVNSADDIEIFSAIDGNKAKLCLYEPSNQMVNALQELFHLYGYADDEYMSPTYSQMHSRWYFNHYQGDIVIKESYMPSEYEDLIIQKWREGVTFIHKRAYSGGYEWDVEQQYANWESSMIS